MNRYTVPALLLALGIFLGTIAYAQTDEWQSDGACISYVFATTSTSPMRTIESKVTSVTLFGDGVSRVNLQECDPTDVSTCKPLQWDTNGDGVVDNSELDGISAMKSTIQNAEVPGAIRIVVTTAPSSGTNKVRVCTRG